MAFTSDHFDPVTLPQTPWDSDWRILDLSGQGWVEDNVVGTGSSVDDIGDKHISTGATSSSTVQRKTSNPAQLGLALGEDRSRVQWNNRNILEFIGCVDDNTANGIARVKWGVPYSNGVGNLGSAGIGFRIESLDLHGMAHNGSSLSEPDLGLTLTVNESFRVLIESDAGNVKWYVDVGDGAGAILRGTSTGGPTGLGGAGNASVVCEVSNGASSADQELQWNMVRLFCKQS